jgi:5,10-methenyltetrahydromethanopterin hydrogenase
MKKMVNPVVCQTTGQVFDANDYVSRLNHFENEATIKAMIEAHPPDVKARIKNWQKEDRNRDNSRKEKPRK